MNSSKSALTLALLIVGVGLAVNGHCQQAKFQLITNGFSSYAAAKADAESRGGHLATITSDAEWRMFTNTVGRAFTNGTWWLGASDVVQEGTWVWLTGETTIYSQWASGEPSGTGVNGNEDYLVLNNEGMWNDAAAIIQVQIGYVLEFEEEVSLVKAVKPAFSRLAIGTNYQLQVSGDLNSWTNHGSPFAATNATMVYPQYWDVDNWSSLFFRIRRTP